MSNTKLARVIKEVGTFYVDLARVVFSGELVADQMAGEPDLQISGLDITMEVKGSSIVNAAPIFRSQLERHLDGLFPSSPFNACVYAIFLYYNRNKRKYRITELLKRGEPAARYLRKHTRDLFLLDATAIQRMMQARTLRQRDGNMVLAFELRTRVLRLLHTDAPAFYKRFGLVAKEFPVKLYRIRVSGMEFPVAVLAPASVQRRIQKVLAPRVVSA